MVSRSCINDGKKLADQRRDNIFEVTSGDRSLFSYPVIFPAFKCHRSVLMSASTLFVSVYIVSQSNDMFAYILRALRAYLQNPND